MDTILRLFIKNHTDVNNPAVREKYGTFASVFGIFCNLLLSLLKITVGLLWGSISVTADGFNNLSDMGSSVITLIAFKISGKPADEDHPFGHGRAEYLSGFIIAVLILLLGGELLKSSVTSLIKGEAAPRYTTLVLVLLAVSVAVKLFMYIFVKNLASRIQSAPLFATASDSVNDAVASFVILLGAFITKLVALPFNLDAVLGILVAGFIIYSGIGVARETVDKLLGEPPTAELIDTLEKTILSFEDFRGIHDLIVHNYGPGRVFASVHVEVPQTVDIVECHERVDLCEKVVNEKTGVLLTIHMDPVDTDNAEITAVKQALEQKLKEIDKRITIHDFRMTPKAKQRTNLIFDAVLPPKTGLTKEEFKAVISQKAKEIDQTFVCVITVDDDFTGRR